MGVGGLRRRGIGVGGRSGRGAGCWGRSPAPTTLPMFSRLEAVSALKEAGSPPPRRGESNPGAYGTCCLQGGPAGG